MAPSLEKLEDCLPGVENPEQAYSKKELLRYVNSFLEALTETERKVFYVSLLALGHYTGNCRQVWFFTE